MTAAGKSAVRRAFEGASGNQWPTVRQEYIATRIAALYDPFSVDDLDASTVAVDLVRRAYLQGLREAVKVEDEGPEARVHREADYTLRLMQMFSSQADTDWVSAEEFNRVELAIRNAFRAGFDEGRLPIGAVI